MVVFNQWHVEELTLDLDSNTQGAIPIIYGRQGDKDGILCNIELTQQGVPVQQSWFAGKRVYFESRGNGVSVRKQVEEIVDGVVKVILPESVFTHIGLVKENFLRVEDASTGNTIISGTSSFQVYVRKGNLDPNASAYYLEEVEHIVADIDDWVTVLKDLLEQYAQDGQKEFDLWFNSVKEVLYGIDPGGNILRELVEARTDDSGHTFSNLKSRLDAFERITDTQFAQTEEEIKSINRTGIYNLNYLKKIREKKPFSVNVMLDSIGAGSNAVGNFGFIAQLLEAMNVTQGGINHLFGDFYYNSNVSTWKKEETGLSKHLLSSSDTSTPLVLNNLAAQIPAKEYKAQIIYSKRPDGGTFEVRTTSDLLLDTISCLGESVDGLITALYNVPAGKSVKIVPLAGNKAYINGWETYLDYSTPSYKLRGLGQGGRKAKDYTDSELVTNVKFNTPDLLIWELAANDFSGGDLETFKQKTILAMETAKSIEADILITVTCGNSTSETSNYRSLWVNFLKEMSVEYKTALIDYDEIFGGYTKANANGLMSDTIHPTDLGHLLMANDLIQVVLDTENPYKYKTVIEKTDTRQPFYNSIQKKESNHFRDEQFFAETPSVYSTDNNGNRNYRKIPKIVSPPSSIAQLPKFEEFGQIATFVRRLYVNTKDWGANKNTTAADWQRAFAYPEMEEITSQPTSVTDVYLNRLFRLSIPGKDDQIITYIKSSAGSRKWVKFATADTIEWT